MTFSAFKRGIFLVTCTLFFAVSCKRVEKNPVSGALNDTVIHTAATDFYALSFAVEKKSDKSPGKAKAETQKNIYTCGDLISFNLDSSKNSPPIDSVQVSMGSVQTQFQKNENSFNFPTKDLNPGKYRLRVRIFMDGGKSESHAVDVTLLSDIVPSNYTYKVVREYPHDKTAYTQGLEYHDGYLYEGTGTNGGSSLRKVELETGEILKFKNLSSELFGEGITFLNNKIYQITYRSQVGFVYDAENFNQINKIYYQMEEGWGLCNNGHSILMSDGTNLIYYMDTTYFSVQKKIEIYDHSGEVNLLNELELINGTLYANRYTTNEIVMIDTATGKLTGRIDMTGLLKPADKHPSIDYFNGIAWDKKNNRIFVTGKNWPKLYEVKFIEVKGKK